MGCQWHPLGAPCSARRIAGSVSIGRFAGWVCFTHLQRVQLVARLIGWRLTFEPVTR